MLKNYLTLAIRNLIKRKVFSFINIFGLAIGIAACLVILKYIDFETSYDNFHVNGRELYRINRTVFQNGEEKVDYTTSSYGLGPELTSRIPELKTYIRVHPMYGGTVMSYQPTSGNARSFHEDNTLIVDSTFLKAFTFQPVEGNLATALDNPNSIVITSSIAKKYFGDEDPVGKTLTLSGGWIEGDYLITAVIENVPGNSSFHFDVLLPLHNIFLRDQYKNDDGWDWNNFITYVELNNNTTRSSVIEKLSDFSAKVIDTRHPESKIKTILNLQPIRNIHLNPGLRGDGDTISRSTIYFFALIAIFILLIAWINYVNLSTARAVERSHEVGIKKAIGALRSQLVSQFFLESVLINLLGLALALGLAIVLLPVLSKTIGKNLFFNFSDIRFWLILFGLFIFGSLASGVYPALALSSFKITSGFKTSQENKTFSLRKVLVVFQFSASLILIAGTFTVYRQIYFMRTKDKGLQMDQMLVVQGPYTLKYKVAKEKLAIFKEEVKKLPGVTGAATSAAIPGGGYNWGTYINKVGVQAEDAKNGSIAWIDPDFIDLYKIGFLAGHNFNPNVRSDMQSVIINEASLKAFGLGTPEQALSERLVMGSDTLQVLGVLKNYNWNSLKSEFTPFLFRADTISTADVSIHLAGGPSLHSTIDKIGSLYKELIPGEPYNFYFLDDFFNSQYKSDRQFDTIFGLFAILAVSISCLGLWGLASFTTTQKLKEIGVRKVLGASTGGIVYLLSKQFLILILVASVISIPIAWYGIDSWLNGFAFRIGIQWDLFIVPVLILTLVALFTISVQVIKGATTNPARVLRTE